MKEVIVNKENQEVVDLFECGKQARLASDGNYYLCTEYYGSAYKIAGKVKRVNYKKTGSFVDIDNDDDMCQEADRLNTYFLRVTLENKGYDVRQKRGSIIVDGYKIRFDGLGYSMYDKYRGLQINVMDNNRDFPTADSVISFIETSQVELEDRKHSAQENLEEQRRVLYLRNFTDYEDFVNQKLDDGKSSKALIASEKKEDLHAQQMKNVTDWLDGTLTKKLYFSRFRKILKSYPKDWMQFMANSGKVAKKKITREDFLTYVSELLTEFGY